MASEKTSKTFFIATYAFNGGNGGTEPIIKPPPHCIQHETGIDWVFSNRDGTYDRVVSEFYFDPDTKRSFTLRRVSAADDVQYWADGERTIIISAGGRLKEVSISSLDPVTYESVGNHMNALFQGLTYDWSSRHVYVGSPEPENQVQQQNRLDKPFLEC
jgi:hypothetical protein